MLRTSATLSPTSTKLAWSRTPVAAIVNPVLVHLLISALHACIHGKALLWTLWKCARILQWPTSLSKSEIALCIGAYNIL